MAAPPRRRRALAAGAALAVGLAGCGSQGPEYDLKTPPAAVSAAPIDAPRSKPATPPTEPQPSQRDAERLRPVLAGWAEAVRRGDPDRAARDGRMWSARSGSSSGPAGSASRPASSSAWPSSSRGRRFTEWRQVPDRPGARPGPEQPEDAATPAGGPA